MRKRKVRNFAEFSLWAKIKMLERGVSQRELAEGMGTYQARISEAITGKPSGKKYIIPLINELGGNIDDFDGIAEGDLDEERNDQESNF